MNQGRNRDLFHILLLVILALIFWAPALMPGQVLFFRDLCGEIIPKRGFWADAGGFFLWNPYRFFGIPEAANPQTEAFYPFNFFYLCFGPERGIIYYIVFHQVLLLAGFYAALRRLGFSPDASLIASAGFGFSGFIVSLSLLIVLLSTVAWFPLVIILLDRAARERWLRSSLLLGLVMAIQILAGEMEMAIMSWMLALLAVWLSPRSGIAPKIWLRSLGALLLGLAIAMVLSLPQLALTLELIPRSNRGSGLSLESASAWALEWGRLKSFLLPNYILPLSETGGNRYWMLGFFAGGPYILSYYLGITLAPLVMVSFARGHRIKSLLWVMIGALGLGLALGNRLPFYRVLFEHLPAFSLFRIPEKLVFPVFVSFAMLTALGAEAIQAKAWRFSKTGWLLFFAGGITLALMLAFPLRLEILGMDFERVRHYLFNRVSWRVCGLALMSLGLVLLAAAKNKTWPMRALALLVFADLFLALHQLNPPLGRDFYQPNAFIREFKQQQEKRTYPVRIISLKNPDDLSINKVRDPVQLYRNTRDSLYSSWALYFKLDDTDLLSSFYARDFDQFHQLAKNPDPLMARLIYSRSGIEYTYTRRQGFVPVGLPFPRARIFYSARALADQDQILSIWSDPNFPALQTALLESESGNQAGTKALSMSEPARVIDYKNELARIEANAKEEAWLVLLDSYYPGWKASIGDKELKIYRADGFFRGVKIPAGKSVIEFRYAPSRFKWALRASGLGGLIWIGLLIISRGKKNDRDQRRQS